MQNRRARLDDRPTDRSDDSMNHPAKTHIPHQIQKHVYRGRRKMQNS